VREREVYVTILVTITKPRTSTRLFWGLQRSKRWSRHAAKESERTVQDESCDFGFSLAKSNCFGDIVSLSNFSVNALAI
jgi:hypothetical protein